MNISNSPFNVLDLVISLIFYPCIMTWWGHENALHSMNGFTATEISSERCLCASIFGSSIFSSLSAMLATRHGEIMHFIFNTSIKRHNEPRCFNVLFISQIKPSFFFPVPSKETDISVPRDGGICTRHFWPRWKTKEEIPIRRHAWDFHSHNQEWVSM